MRRIIERTGEFYLNYKLEIRLPCSHVRSTTCSIPLQLLFNFLIDCQLSARCQSWNFSTRSRLINRNCYLQCKCRREIFAIIDTIPSRSSLEWGWKRSGWSKSFSDSRQKTVSGHQARWTSGTLTIRCQLTTPTLRRKFSTGKLKIITRARSPKATDLFSIKICNKLCNIFC